VAISAGWSPKLPSRSREALGEESSDDCDDGDGDVFAPELVVIQRQPLTSVYPNPLGQICIRQQGDGYDDDAWIILDPMHIEAVIRALRWTAQVIADAIEADPDAFKAPPPAPPPKPIKATRPPPPPMPPLRERIEAALVTDPKCSNREIATEIGCGETTVRRDRSALAAPITAPPPAPSPVMARANGIHGAPALFAKEKARRFPDGPEARD
jgi:hypothetical protein